MKKTIDFAIVTEALYCAPNNDMLDENRPRQDYDTGLGLMTPGCIKHKIRMALENMTGQQLYMTENTADGFHCLDERADSAIAEFVKVKPDSPEYKSEAARAICKKYLDARLFGFLVPKTQISQRGAVTVQMARTVDPISIMQVQITKCISQKPAPKGKPKKEDSEEKDTNKRGSDQLGTYFVVPFGLYVTFGSIDTILADEKHCNLSDADIDALKQAILHMYDFDASLPRPAGSLNVRNLFWFEQDERSVSLAKIMDALHIAKKDGVSKPSAYSDYTVSMDAIPGVKVTDLANPQ